VTVKVRSCSICNATIIKSEAEVKLYAEIGSPLCPTCTKVMLGEDKPEYWTEVRE